MSAAPLWERTEDGTLRRTTRPAPLVTYAGKTLTVTQWAREVGIPRTVLYCRLVALGWPVERALTEQVGAPRPAPVTCCTCGQRVRAPRPAAP